MWGTLVNHCWREIERIKYDWPNHSMWILWDIPSGHVWNIREDQWIYPTRVDTPIYLNMDEHGTLNVPIEHHPTIRYMVYNGYYKVMSNISKMGQLPTPATLEAFFAAPHAVLFLVSASSLDVCDKGCAGLKHKLCHVVWVDLAQRRTWGFTGCFGLQ